jgi:hypothetical protein
MEAIMKKQRKTANVFFGLLAVLLLTAYIHTSCDGNGDDDLGTPTQTPTPVFTANMAVKAPEGQAAINFTLNSDPGAGIWKVYQTANAAAVSTIVGVTVSGTTLTLADLDEDDIPVGNYHVSFTRLGNFTESNRVMLTVNQRTETPEFEFISKEKDTAIQTCVVFILSEAYGSGAGWKVYDSNTATNVSADITVAVVGVELTLSHGVNIMNGDYYVTFTDQQFFFSESERVRLTVGVYKPTTPTPVLAVGETASKAKSSPTATTVSFNLNTTAPNPTFDPVEDEIQIYTHATEDLSETTTEVSFGAGGSTIILTDAERAGGIEERQYWITVTIDDHRESARLPLTVTAFVPSQSIPPVLANPADWQVQKTVISQASVTFTLADFVFNSPADVLFLYLQATGGTAVSVPAVSVQDNVLTLSVDPASTGIVARDYWVSVRRYNETESSRLALRVLAPTPSPQPDVVNYRVKKDSFNADSVEFTLETAAIGTDEFNVYSYSTGTAAPAYVVAEAAGTALTLKNTEARLLPGAYYITITNQDMPESERVMVYVEEFLAIGQSAIPTTEHPVRRKRTLDQERVDFILDKTYIAQDVFTLFDDEERTITTSSDRATVEVNGYTLSLVNATGVATGYYFVTVLEDGDDDPSYPLKLTVGVAFVDISPAHMAAEDIVEEILAIMEQEELEAVGVVGERTNFDETINLAIPGGHTVLWSANLTGTARATATGNVLIDVTGPGRLEIEDGTITALGTRGIAIRIGAGGYVYVCGGTVSSSSTNDNDGAIVLAAGTARLSMSSGIIENMAANASARAIRNGSTNEVVISGGTVRAGIGVAINNVVNSALLRISETYPGVPTLITSANVTTGAGTIFVSTQANNGNSVRITGGRVENTADNANARAIRIQVGAGANGLVISGGEVVATGAGIVIWHQLSGGQVTIEGTAVVRTGNNVAVYMNNATHTINVRGDAIVYSIGTSAFGTGQGANNLNTMSTSGGTSSTPSRVTQNAVVIALAADTTPGANGSDDGIVFVASAANTADATVTWEDGKIKVDSGTNQRTIDP